MSLSFLRNSCKWYPIVICAFIHSADHLTVHLCLHMYQRFFTLNGCTTLYLFTSHWMFVSLGVWALLCVLENWYFCLWRITTRSRNGIAELDVKPGFNVLKNSLGWLLFSWLWQNSRQRQGKDEFIWSQGLSGWECVAQEPEVTGHIVSVEGKDGICFLLFIWSIQPMRGASHIQDGSPLR